LLMRRFGFTFVSILFLLPAVAAAQGRIDACFGMGTAHAGSTGEIVDYMGDGVAVVTPSMGGVFGTLGGGFMLTPSLGVGAEVTFRFTQGDYGGLGYRSLSRRSPRNRHFRSRFSLNRSVLFRQEVK
jgi:hypothetical protein